MFKIILQLHGGGGKGKGGGGGGQSTSGYTNVDTDTTKTTNPFTSDETKKNYADYFGAAKDNYLRGIESSNQIQNYINKLQKQNGGAGDTSYFKQGWNSAMGIDQSNLNKLNTQSFNPNDNADWVKANDDIDKNARLGWGQYNNQLMQNMIGTNMANGSGHQTAAARQSAMLNSQLAADRANRWQQQYNQNVQNTLAANGQLENFYSTLSNIGIDYAKLSQQDLSTLLSAYQSMSDINNNALKSYGQAVELGSDPTETSHTHKEGEEAMTQQQQQSGWDTAGNVLGLVGTMGRIFKW